MTSLVTLGTLDVTTLSVKMFKVCKCVANSNTNNCGGLRTSGVVCSAAGATVAVGVATAGATDTHPL